MVSERSRRCRAVPARGCCEPKDVRINQRPRLIFRRLYLVHRNRALLLCSSRSLLFTASNPYTSKRLICITKTKNSVSGFACSLLDRQPIIRSKNGRARVCRLLTDEALLHKNTAHGCEELLRPALLALFSLRAPSSRFTRGALWRLRSGLACWRTAQAGFRIPLPEQPFQLLAILLEHAGEVVTRKTAEAPLAEVCANSHRKTVPF